MRSHGRVKIFVAALFLGLVLSPLLRGAEVTQRTVILSTTTSTQDSGLLDVLIPLFEKQTGYSVKIVSVGTGPRPDAYGEGRCRLVLGQAPIDRSINGLSILLKNPLGILSYQ